MRDITSAAAPDLPSSPAASTSSAQLFARAQQVLPGGVSRNTVLRDPHPLYAETANGCYVTDIEGVRRIDFANNMASLIHGHACPQIVEAVTEQLSRGSAFTMATEVEVRYAEHLCSRSPSFEKVRFVNSGTEAVMVAIKAARAYTGRPKIAKIEGAYHGVYDYAEVSQASEPENWGSPDRPASVSLVYGTPQSVLDDVVVLPFNDPRRAIAILNEHKETLACVLLDLMPHRVGLYPADDEFVTALREWTERNGALLVLDEVITFRTAFGGLQSRYHIMPDLTALGKVIGGGFPIGAVAGRAEVLDVMNPNAVGREGKLPFPHSGTFSANPISMTAGLTAMELFDADAVTRLTALGQRAVDGIERAIGETGIAACVTGGGSMFRVHMKSTPPRNYRDAYLDVHERRKLTMLLEHLFANGCMLINTGSFTLSTAMTEAEVDRLVDAMRGAFEQLVEAG